MPPIVFEFKKAGAAYAKLVAFEDLPNWSDLASNVAQDFLILPEHVGVAYVDEARGGFHLKNEQDLQAFYKLPGQPSEVIKLVVQDCKAPDPSIPATWSMDSNLPDLLKSEENFKLFCFILGSDRLFSVEIARSKTVDDLKKVIKKEKEHELGHVDGDALYLWQVDIDLETFDEDSFPKLAFTKDDEGAHRLKEWNFVSDYWSEQPEAGRVHVFVKAPATGELKRPFAFDDAGPIIERWRSKRLKSKLPEIAELTSIANQPLADGDKIPIPEAIMNALVSSRDLRDFCTLDDVKLLFRAGDGYSILDKYLIAVQDRPPDQGAEQAFISFWDRNVRDVLEVVVDTGTSQRNSSQHIETRNLRPDYSFIVDKLCVFRGEEKSPDNHEDPRGELAEKLCWAYAPAPYVLGYYATGPDLTLVAISPPARLQDPPIIHNIVSANLRHRKDRIKNICRLINLSGLFHSITDLVRLPDAEFTKLQREFGTIEIAGRSIIKTYTSPDKNNRVQHLKRVYCQLENKNVPCVDHLTYSYDATVVLSPRGIAEEPANEKELLEALVCVLKALEILHQTPPLFHRDIRWPNVMRSLEDPSAWFLIDWEDAATPPTYAHPHLSRNHHCPGVFTDDHGAEVDMWGVGELILQSKALGITQRLKDLGRWMQGPNSVSAQEALHKIKSYLDFKVFFTIV